ncbi:hypothetical protein K439DRAFT_1638217 [Ramaria rubella]|nr:hypothetical protein K439DRAFT_1638217 [Ramaria rubella]
MASVSPVRKRVRLDPSASPSPPPSNELKLQRRETAHSVFDDRVGMPQHDELLEVDIAEEDDEDYCVICLHHIRDRTVLPCAHDRLCFECIYVWCQQSRKCPLCNASIGPFLIHNFRSKYDYSKYYLSPLELSTPNAGPLARSEFIPRTRGRTRGPQPHWGTRRRNASGSPERRDREDELELAIARRRWVYRHGLYAKHVASNPYTRYHPAPTPAQISSSPDLISRTTIFVRRELRVWVNLDVEFLTTFILSLMKTLDLRSEPAVKLLAEFLDMDTPYYVGEPEADSTGRFKNAEHFSHELYSYLRSPFRELAAYDSAVQYDTPAHVPPPPPQRLDERHGPRWDLRTSSRAEPSGPHRRRHSSPSPLSRSPRDAYSPSSSPAPSQFRNDFEHHDSPQPEPVNRPQRAYRINNSSSTAAKTRTDTKGKGRTESLPSKADTWRLHYEDRFHHLPEERRVQSSSRSLVQPDVNSPSREPHRHSSFAVSSMVKGIRQERSDSGLHSGSPLTSLPLYESTGDSNRREDIPRDLPTREQSCLRERDHSVKAVDHQPETQDTPWGISIKGQAKLLDLPREAVLMISDSHRETRSTDAHTTSLPKKRSRVLDVVHAHLRPSYTLPAKRSATIGNSAKHPPAEERAPSRDSDVLEGSRYVSLMHAVCWENLGASQK